MSTRYRFLPVLLISAALTGSCIPRSSLRDAAAWVEADQLFRHDASWVGGDAAYSVDLGNGRVLWLFGDSWIDPSGGHLRDRMVSNSVAIQDGYDPSSAQIRFFWRTGSDGLPRPFFPNRGTERYWPGHGIRLGDHLLLFLMRVKSIATGLGFEVYDWDAVLVRNPDDVPREWELTWLETPKNDRQIIVGSASVLSKDGYVYAYSTQEPTAQHDVYLVRWRESDAREGKLMDLEWWAGDAEGWVPDRHQLTPPHPVLNGGQTEFTVHYDSSSQRYLQVQTVGFGSAAVTLRSAAKLTGPWSEPDTLYRPPELSKPGILIYAGKAHPHLRGADLVLTYATNSFDFQELVRDTTIYYPRFVRVSRGGRLDRGLTRD